MNSMAFLKTRDTSLKKVRSPLTRVPLFFCVCVGASRPAPSPAAAAAPPRAYSPRTTFHATVHKSIGRLIIAQYPGTSRSLTGCRKMPIVSHVHISRNISRILASAEFAGAGARLAARSRAAWTRASTAAASSLSESGVGVGGEAAPRSCALARLSSSS